MAELKRRNIESQGKVRLARSVDKPRSALKSASSNNENRSNRSVKFTDPLVEVHYFDPKQTIKIRYRSNEIGSMSDWNPQKTQVTKTSNSVTELLDLKLLGLKTA